jgi:hypothetical protein
MGRKAAEGGGLGGAGGPPGVLAKGPLGLEGGGVGALVGSEGSGAGAWAGSEDDAEDWEDTSNRLVSSAAGGRGVGSGAGAPTAGAATGRAATGGGAGGGTGAALADAGRRPAEVRLAACEPVALRAGRLEREEGVAMARREGGDEKTRTVWRGAGGGAVSRRGPRNR